MNIESVNDNNTYKLLNDLLHNECDVLEKLLKAEEKYRFLEEWVKHKNFIFDFTNHIKTYGNNKGHNTKHSCLFCGGGNSVQKVNIYDGNYYCSKCTHQIYRHGKPFETTNKYILYDDYVGIEITRQYGSAVVVKIDHKSVPLIFYYKWHCGLGVNGYCNSSEKISMHRLIVDLDKDDNCIVDHINRDTLDNRKSNLRICNYISNCRNSSVYTNNKSGFIGVSFSKEKNKWRSTINLPSKKQVFLGYYNNVEDALIARLNAEKLYFGDFAPQKHLYEKYNIKNANELIIRKE